MPIFLPEKCLRNRVDCLPLSQISSNDEVDGVPCSFVCAGTNNGNMATEKQDIFTMCWKNEQVDQMDCWDKRDLTDTASVICQALSVIENDSLLDEDDKYLFKTG